MSLFPYLSKPEYLLRPRSVIRRLRSKQRPRPEYEIVKLPWSLHIRVRPLDAIGSAIESHEVYDLTASEAIWRLLNVGDSAIDVGANIGYMTSLMAARVGEQGTVSSFEPHPELHEELRQNVLGWADNPRVALIHTYQIALSNTCGTGLLTCSAAFASNRGTAKLSTNPSRAAADSELPVITATLAHCLPHVAAKLLKIDVEGHELQVMEGARTLLAAGRIRHIIYEDLCRYPSRASRFLEAMGYTVFRLGRTTFGPKALCPKAPHDGIPWEPINYLGTLDSEAALERLAPRGWAVLGFHPRTSDVY